MVNAGGMAASRSGGGLVSQLSAPLIALRSRLAEHEDGQGMVEYALIITAVAIAVIIAIFALGPKIASMFSTAGASLG